MSGRIWTTDAMYRETKNKIAERKADGCIAVEMEVAGVQAVCNYIHANLYNFLVTGNVLDKPDYKYDELHSANHSLNKFHIALKIAKELS